MQRNLRGSQRRPTFSSETRPEPVLLPSAKGHFVLRITLKQQLTETRYQQVHTMYQQLFKPAEIVFCAYLNNGVEDHVVKVLYRDQSHEDYAKLMDRLDIITETRDLPPSKLYQDDFMVANAQVMDSMNELFNLVGGLQCQHLYGTTDYLNKFLEAQPSQKDIRKMFMEPREAFHSFPKLEINSQGVLTMMIRHQEQDQTLQPFLKGFPKQFEGLDLFQLSRMETYSYLPSISEHWATRSRLIFKTKTPSEVKVMDNYLKSIEGILREKERIFKGISFIENCDVSTIGMLSSAVQVITHFGDDSLFKQALNAAEFPERITHIDARLIETEVETETEKTVINKPLQQSKGKVRNNFRHVFTLFFDKQLDENVYDRFKGQLLTEGVRIVNVTGYKLDGGQFIVSVSVDPSDKGLSRQFFNGFTGRGTKILEQMRLKPSAIKSYDSREDFFKQLRIVKVVYGDSKLLDTFNGQQEAKAKFEQLSQEFVASKDTLTQQFHSGIISEMFSSVAEFKTKHEKDWKALSLIIANDKLLESMAYHFNKNAYDKLESVHPTVTLQQFVHLNQGAIASLPPLTDQILKENNLKEAIDAIYKVHVVIERQKTGCTLFWGDPDTGKTTLSRMLTKIFITHEQVQTRSRFDVNPFLLKTRFQILVIDEVSFPKLFNPANLADTKRLFEREGSVTEVKFANAGRMYVGASVFLSTNSDPLGKLDPLEQEAIRARCEVVQMFKREDQPKRFPFNEYQLAAYFHNRYNLERREDTEMEDDYEDDEEESSPFENLDDQVDLILEEEKIELSIQERKPFENLNDQVDLILKEVKRLPVHLKQLQTFYKEYCPFNIIYRIFYDQFSKREFSFQVLKGDQDIFCRFNNFKDFKHMSNQFANKIYTNVTNGAIYNVKPDSVSRDERREKLVAIESELAFDIDMDSYDELRECCKGKKVCSVCWDKFIVPSVKLIQDVLLNKLKFYKTLWTFSGSRGVHCRVFDDYARAMTNEEREAVYNMCIAEAVSYNVVLRLDSPITKDRTHLLKVPLMIHPGSQRLITPFIAKDVEDFVVEDVPYLEQILKNPSLMEPYLNVAEIFIQTLKDKKDPLYQFKRECFDRELAISEFLNMKETDTPMDETSVKDIAQSFSGFDTLIDRQ